MTIQPPEGTMRTRNVGEIAATVPGATAVFRRFRLDFCCHGDLPLEAAAARRGVDPAEIEQALDALASADAPTPVASMSSAELIDRIETCYHDAHRHDLPELMALARKVEAVHREHPKVPNGLFSTLEEMQSELESHMRVEETTIFPMMRAETPDELHRAIGALRHEHDDQARLLHRLESLTDNFTLPEGACRSWQALYVSTAQFVTDVMEHIHLENNVLFPRFAETAARIEE
jgi:regulator of cell morphogenesis and NO signaling